MRRAAHYRWLLALLGLALLGLALLVLGGCGPRMTTISPADDSPADQWSRGVWLYGQYCAGCHGDDGAGDEDSPALVGEGALTTRPGPDGEPAGTFANAADLHAYILAEKPPLEPGSLSDEQVWAVLVYVLRQAEIDTPEGALGPHNAASVPLR